MHCCDRSNRSIKRRRIIAAWRRKPHLSATSDTPTTVIIVMSLIIYSSSINTLYRSTVTRNHTAAGNRQLETLRSCGIWPPNQHRMSFVPSARRSSQLSNVPAYGRAASAAAVQETQCRAGICIRPPSHRSRRRSRSTNEQRNDAIRIGLNDL